MTWRRIASRARRAWAWLDRRPPEPSQVSLAQPVFVWGVGRSGTYLLYDLLSLHPQLCCNSTWGERKKKGLWGSWHWGENPEYRALTAGRPAPVEGVLRFWGERFDQRSLMERRPQIDEATVRSVRERYLELRRGPGPERFRVLDKSPVYLLMAEEIDRVFPDAWHVWCLRDPRANLRSILRIQAGRIFEEDYERHSVWGELRPPGYRGYYKLEFFRRHLWQLLRLIELCQAQHSRLGARCVVFPLELLAADSHQALGRLFSRLGLALSAGLAALPGRFPSLTEPHPSDEFWAEVQASLDAPGMAMLQELARAAQQLGYAAAEEGRLSDDGARWGWAARSPAPA